MGTIAGLLAQLTEQLDRRKSQNCSRGMGCAVATKNTHLVSDLPLHNAFTGYLPSYGRRRLARVLLSESLIGQNY